MRKRLLLVGLLAVAVAPVIAVAPRPTPRHPEGVDTLEDAVECCRRTGLEGWELVEYAQQLVHRKFVKFSILNVWETPALAFRNSRGYANQYNSALWHVLVALGFDARRVFAARVRQDLNPWWRMGHTWVEVTIDGRTLEVCASKADNRPGAVLFIPVTDVRPFRTLTYWNTNSGMIVFSMIEVWKALLARRELPPWMYRDFAAEGGRPSSGPAPTMQDS